MSLDQVTQAPLKSSVLLYWKRCYERREEGGGKGEATGARLGKRLLRRLFMACGMQANMWSIWALQQMCGGSPCSFVCGRRRSSGPSP